MCKLDLMDLPTSNYRPHLVTEQCSSLHDNLGQKLSRHVIENVVCILTLDTLTDSQEKISQNVI